MDIASEKVISQELARESLMAISKCIPDTSLASNWLPEKSVVADVPDQRDCGGVEDYRLKLISISYIQAPDVQPLPLPPFVENPSG